MKEEAADAQRAVEEARRAVEEARAMQDAEAQAEVRKKGRKLHNLLCYLTYRRACIDK